MWLLVGFIQFFLNLMKEYMVKPDDIRSCIDRIDGKCIEHTVGCFNVERAEWISLRELTFKIFMLIEDLLPWCDCLENSGVLSL